MIDLVDICKKADKITDIYKGNLLKDLNKQKEKINDILLKALVDYCEENSMMQHNTVYEKINPFEISGRVKAWESINEKLFRGTHVLNIFDTSKRKIANNILKEIDDVIGFTILTDTYMDIENYKNFFLPELLDKNGFSLVNPSAKFEKDFYDIEYYNYKLLFNGKYPVEIQVKSKLLSVYANMEHKLSYKNKNINRFSNYNKNIIHSLTPTIAAMDKILREVSDSEKDEIEKEFIFIREKLIESEIRNKYNNDYKRLASFISDIDVFLNKIFIGYAKINKIQLSNKTVDELGKEYIKFISALKSQDMDGIYIESKLKQMAEGNYSFAIICSIINNCSLLLKSYIAAIILENTNDANEIQTKNELIEKLISSLKNKGDLIQNIPCFPPNIGSKIVVVEQKKSREYFSKILGEIANFNEIFEENKISEEKLKEANNIFIIMLLSGDDNNLKNILRIELDNILLNCLDAENLDNVVETINMLLE